MGMKLKLSTLFGALLLALGLSLPASAEDRSRALNEVIQAAQADAVARNHTEFTAEHILLALLKGDHRTALSKLTSKENLDQLQGELETKLNKLPKSRSVVTKAVYDHSANLLIRKMTEAAKANREMMLHTDHLVMALTESEFPEINRQLEQVGITNAKATEQYKAARTATTTSAKSVSTIPNALDEFGRNLTREAQQGRLPKVVGRDRLIENMGISLAKDGKHGVLLHAEPGVGKTATVEGFAQAVVEGKIPTFEGWEVYKIDLRRLNSDTKYQGTFSDHIKAVLADVEARGGKVILFIDEIHRIYQTGNTNEQIGKLGEELKDIQDRAQGIYLIGATTTNEYKQYLEKSDAVERRYDIFYIPPPGYEDTIVILRGDRERYEQNGVILHDSVFEEAARLGREFYPRLNSPDREITLLQNVASRVAAEANGSSTPHVIYELRARLEQINRTMARLPARLQSSTEALRLQDQFRAVNEQLHEKERLLARGKELLKQIPEAERALRNLEITRRGFGANRAAEADFTITKLEPAQKALAAMREEMHLIQEHHKMLRKIVTIEMLHQEVATQKNLTVQFVARNDQVLFETLDADLIRLSNQPEAVQEYVSAHQRARARTRDGSRGSRATGIYLSTGNSRDAILPLAEGIAETVYGTRNAIIRIDLAAHSKGNGILGVPAGFHAGDKESQFSKFLSRTPHAVVVFTNFIQVPDFELIAQGALDGRIVDTTGTLIDLKGFTFIFHQPFTEAELQGKTLDEISVDYEVNFHRNFPDIFAGLDAVLPPLKAPDAQDARELVRDQVATWRAARYESKLQLVVDLTEEAMEWLVREVEKTPLHRRPMVVSKKLDDLLSPAEINNVIQADDQILIRAVENGGLYWEPDTGEYAEQQAAKKRVAIAHLEGHHTFPTDAEAIAAGVLPGPTVAEVAPPESFGPPAPEGTLKPTEENPGLAKAGEPTIRPPAPSAGDEDCAGGAIHINDPNPPGTL
jgi:ATP-dependent Clp protease ATP-binding subunit ClpB